MSPFSDACICVTLSDRYLYELSENKQLVHVHLENLCAGSKVDWDSVQDAGGYLMWFRLQLLEPD